MCATTCVWWQGQSVDEGSDVEAASVDIPPNENRGVATAVKGDGAVGVAAGAVVGSAAEAFISAVNPPNENTGDAAIHHSVVPVVCV